MSVNDSQSFTSDLCRFVSELRYEHLDREVINRVKMCLIDWLGLAIRGSQEELSHDIHNLIVSGALSGVCSVFGTRLKTNEYFAALANGAQGHAIDYDDTHEPSLVHVSASLWPAILAAAQVRGKDGKQIIAAYVAGVEVQALVGRYFGVELTSRGFHATSILGHLGAAASTSNLFELDSTRTEMALGIAATQAGGLGASFGTMSKPLHPGKAAMDALLAVHLGELGFTGPEDVIEGESGLFATYLGAMPELSFPNNYRAGSSVLEISIKPYPSCLLTHPSIDGAIYLAREYQGIANQVEIIECHVNPLAVKIAGKRNPKTQLDAKFSIQFCVSTALRNGEVLESDFTEKTFGDPNVSELSERVALVADASLETTQAVIRINTGNSHFVEHRVEIAKGNPSNPMTDEESFRKFASVSEPTLGAEAVKRLRELCLDLEDLSEIGCLSDLLPQNQTDNVATMGEI